MIKRLKTQLSSPPYTLAALLLLPLAGFFFYARYYSSQFFFTLAGSLAVNMCYLVYSYYSLSNRQAVIALERGEYEERLNLAQADMTREKQANASLREKIANFSILKNLTEKLCASFSLADTSYAIAQDVNGLYGDKDMTVVVYLFHANTNELSLLTSLRDRKPINLKAKKGDLYDEWVIKNLKPLMAEDTKSDFRFDSEKMQTEDDRPIRSIISVPISVGDKTVGILRVDSAIDRHFTTEDLRFLSTVGNLGAVALENAQLFERVEDLAIRDSLTSVFLRRHLLERLGHEIGRHLRGSRGDPAGRPCKRELSFLMIDLDHFKKYNDQFGHTAGDIVLKTIAQILLDMFNEPGQVVCRYGGEEFCVLLPDCPKAKAAKLAEEIRDRIETRTIILRREKTRITVSLGVAAFPRDAKSKEELVQMADAALYKAKSQGRNRVVTA